MIRFVTNLWVFTKKNGLQGYFWTLDELMIRDNISYNWGVDISEKVLFQIWSDVDPNRHQVSTETSDDPELTHKGQLKVAPYSKPFDILRYMNSAYSHYNDHKFDIYRAKVWMLTNFLLSYKFLNIQFCACSKNMFKF